MYLYPSLASRFMWIARFGMIIRSLSILTSLVSTPSGVCTTTRPATDSGRSSQGAHSMPPYFSTFSFTYRFATVISALGLTLKTGESQWLAMIWKPAISADFTSGTRKAMMADPLRVT